MSYNFPVVKGYKNSIIQDLIKELSKITSLSNENNNKYYFNVSSFISNTIVELDDILEHIVLFLMDSLQQLQCRHVVCNINFQISLDQFKLILSLIENFNIHSCLFLLDFSDHFYSDDFANVIINTNRIDSIIFFNSPFDKNLEDKIYYFKVNKSRSSKKRNSNFRSNRNLFSESQYHHTYFNRKLYIGPNGEIKNAPECEETFGSIKDLNSVEDLKEIISTPAFQKYWFVHKDLCDVCKHCEFRHMCVDNRMPFERADNQWYHKIECNYNPFIAKWEGDPGYRTLSECGVISNENEFSIDHDRIAEINKEIWEEE